MKKLTTLGTALMLTTTAANAGGLDRSGQSIGAIFEDGRYVELSYGHVMPSVTGVFMGFADSGNIAPAYGSFGGAYKMDVDDKVSLAFIVDQPFGADVSYEQAGYPLVGTNAQVTSKSLTVLGRYKFNDNFSVHFGPRALQAAGNVTITAPAAYMSTYQPGSGYGYVTGAAYERKDIALRVALTYASGIDLELDGDGAGGFGDLTVKMPSSWNLDFQSGVAADTLVFGSIRHVAWSEAVIHDAAAGDLVSYDQDTTTYSLGVGRKFSDTFSGALSIGYEKAQGGLASNLAPTDGNMSIGLGGTYTLANGVELTGGVRYVMPGDATTETIGADFSNNSAIAVGLKVAYTF